MSKVDKQRHAELSAQVARLALDLEQAKHDLVEMRENQNTTAAALGKLLLRILGLV